MFDNKNTYTLRKELTGGLTHYYVSFIDGQKAFRETEVSRPVYLEFLRFVRIDRSLRHWDERYKEHSEMTDESLYDRAQYQPKSLEETVFDSMRNEHMRLAISNLTATQRRRFVLYHEFGLTYEQISGIEGCSIVAVKYTIDKAKMAIAKKIKTFSE